MGSVPGERVTLHWAPTSCRSGQMLSHLSPCRQLLLETDCPWVSSGSQMPWGHLPGMEPRRAEDRCRRGRRQALPSARWLPHHVAVQSGQVAWPHWPHCQELHPVPTPTLPPTLSYCYPSDEWFQVCEAHSSVTAEPSQWSFPAS